MRLDNFHIFIRAFATGFAIFLLSRLTFLFYPRFLAHLWSCSESPTYLSPLFACPGTSTTLLSRFLPTLVSESPAVLLLLSVLSPAPPHLAYTALKIFKRALLDEFLHCYLTSLAKLFCLFLPFGLLPNKTDRKWIFDTAFSNYCPFAGNYA